MKIENCDVCKIKIEDKFVDGATRSGPWGNMCPVCHERYGVGFGTGRGQEYTKQADGTFKKTKG